MRGGKDRVWVLSMDGHSPVPFSHLPKVPLLPMALPRRLSIIRFPRAQGWRRFHRSICTVFVTEALESLLIPNRAGLFPLFTELTGVTLLNKMIQGSGAQFHSTHLHTGLCAHTPDRAPSTSVCLLCALHHLWFGCKLQQHPRKITAGKKFNEMIFLYLYSSPSLRNVFSYALAHDRIVRVQKKIVVLVEIKIPSLGL